jgi:hypothetical protein
MFTAASEKCSGIVLTPWHIMPPDIYVCFKEADTGPATNLDANSDAFERLLSISVF